jgi:hypothetical protein
LLAYAKPVADASGPATRVSIGSLPTDASVQSASGKHALRLAIHLIAAKSSPVATISLSLARLLGNATTGRQAAYPPIASVLRGCRRKLSRSGLLPCSKASDDRIARPRACERDLCVDKLSLGWMLAIMDADDLKRLLGPFPARCPLDAVRLEAVDCGSYVRETIEYAVEADKRIKCFILVPKHIDRALPAIFAHHQHAGQFHLGKSEVVGLKGDQEQAYASELAERGYVVIAPDALAFEERNWSIPSGYAEYFELATRLVPTAPDGSGPSPPARCQSVPLARYLVARVLGCIALRSKNSA